MTSSLDAAPAVALLCTRYQGSSFTLWLDIGEARAAAAAFHSCCRTCAGLHSIVVHHAGRWQVHKLDPSKGTD